MISVIVPVYKTEKYIRRCIDSILSQTYQVLELILVDDGSPDGCPAICDEYAKRDPRIKTIHKRNEGVSAARNVGLDNAAGDFVAFIDSDDWVTPTYLEHLLSDMNDDADMVISGAWRDFGDRKTPILAHLPKRFTGQELRENYDTYMPDYSVCMRLYRRSAIGDSRFDVGTLIGEDLRFNLKCYAKCRLIVSNENLEYIYESTNLSSAVHSYKESYFECQKQMYISAKKFKYGDVKFTNDAVDYRLANSGLSRIQWLLLQKNGKNKRERVKDVFNDPLFSVVAKGRYDASFIKFRLPLAFCKHRWYVAVRLYFWARKVFRSAAR